jgi:hypothetical protein
MLLRMRMKYVASQQNKKTNNGFTNLILRSPPKAGVSKDGLKTPIPVVTPTSIP